MKISINIPEFFSNYFKNNKKNSTSTEYIFIYKKKKTNFMSHNPLINKDQIITIL